MIFKTNLHGHTITIDLNQNVAGYTNASLKYHGYNYDLLLCDNGIRIEIVYSQNTIAYCVQNKDSEAGIYDIYIQDDYVYTGTLESAIFNAVSQFSARSISA